jgi:hypothetical protein
VRLSPEALEKESVTEKGAWSGTVAAPVAPATTSRKKGRGGGGRSPLPIVFSLHPASSNVYGTTTHEARFLPPAASRVPQTHTRVEVEEELDRQWVENGGARPATVGPLTSMKEEQAAQAPAPDLR